MKSNKTKICKIIFTGAVLVAINTLSAWAQDAMPAVAVDSASANQDGSFDGVYERRDYVSQNGAKFLDVDFEIHGNTGTWRVYSKGRIANLPCNRQPVPVKITSTDGDIIKYIIQGSTVMTGCNDDPGTYKRITVDGHTGLTSLNQSAIMLVKK